MVPSVSEPATPTPVTMGNQSKSARIWSALLVVSASWLACLGLLVLFLPGASEHGWLQTSKIATFTMMTLWLFIAKPARRWLTLRRAAMIAVPLYAFGAFGLFASVREQSLREEAADRAAKPLGSW